MDGSIDGRIDRQTDKVSWGVSSRRLSVTYFSEDSPEAGGRKSFENSVATRRSAQNHFSEDLSAMRTKSLAIS